MLHKCSTTPAFTFYSLTNLFSHCSYSSSYYMTCCRNVHFPGCMRFWSKNSQSNQVSCFNILKPYIDWYLELLLTWWWMSLWSMNESVQAHKALLLTPNKQLLKNVVIPVFSIVIHDLSWTSALFSKLSQYILKTRLFLISYRPTYFNIFRCSYLQQAYQIQHNSNWCRSYTDTHSLAH